MDNNVKKRNVFGRYGDIVRQVLEALLDRYADSGIEPIEHAADDEQARRILRLPPFSEMGTPMEIARAFSGPQKFMAAIRQLEDEIYRVA